IKKGQGNYCAVLVDLDRGQLWALVSERTQDAIEKVLLSWGKEVLEGIEEVSIDLWLPYKTLREKIMPNASVVADRFHVMNPIQEELNNGRKSAKQKVNKMPNSPEKAAKLKAINGRKFALLKNRENLTDSQNKKREEVLNQFPVLNEMCALKDEFKEIFESSNSWLDGLVKLRNWLKRALNLFPKSQGTVRRWLVEITAYFENKTSNGVVEGVNQKIKLIKRAGFGFRNQENFELRCLLNFID
ncbi:MAG: ISL3 family transposase, partial [Okeania sp. SIO2H7]|nr:ISL3 family transposase [Okeania sp. SIO2H7]